MTFQAQIPNNQQQPIPQPSFFLLIPSHVADDPRIDDSTAILYGRILSLTNNVGYCFASDQYLADMTKVSAREVRRRLKILKDCGYIEVISKKNGVLWDRKIFSKLDYEGTRRSVREDQVVLSNGPGGPDNNIRKNNIRKNNNREPSAVAVFPEKPKKQEPPDPDIPDCLLPINIPDKEKLWAVKNFTLAQIERAAAYISAPETKISTTLVQAFKWALKEQPEPPKCVEDLFEENKQLAEKFENYSAQYVKLIVCNKYAEFTFPGAQKESEIVKYDAKNFKDDFMDLIKRFKFTKDPML